MANLKNINQSWQEYMKVSVRSDLSLKAGMTAWGLRLSDQKKTTLSRRGSTVATAPSIRVEYIFRAPPSRCNRETERAPVLYPDNWPGSSSCLSNRWPWHTCRLRWDCQHVWRSDSPLPGNRPPWHSSCRKCCIDQDCHCHDSCLPSPQESRGCCKERQLCAVVRVSECESDLMRDWRWGEGGRTPSVQTILSVRYLPLSSPATPVWPWRSRCCCCCSPCTSTRMSSPFSVPRKSSMTQTPNLFKCSITIGTVLSNQLLFSLVWVSWVRLPVSWAQSPEMLWQSRFLFNLSFSSCWISSRIWSRSFKLISDDLLRPGAP